MNVYGIICEYNPFHLGHLFHIRQTKRSLPGDSAVVCVMSPEFVQRGEAAVFDCYSRADAAVRSGADLVFELPLPWALSSAEGFARGAVGILTALGNVTHLSFGSECGDIDALQDVATALSSPDFQTLVKAHDRNQSFASARQRAVEALIGSKAELLSHPNNILAIEYLRAIAALDSALVPLTIPRVGPGHDQHTASNQDECAGSGHDQHTASNQDECADSGHDETSQAQFKSASELRAMLASGQDIAPFIPRDAAAVYQREMSMGRAPVTTDRLEIALLSRLRALPAGRFAALPDSTEGFHNRLRRAVASEPTWDAVLHAAKTKRYTLARIRRSLICAALGIDAGMSRGTPAYSTLLAANKRGLQLLRDAKSRAALTVVTKPASAKNLPPDCLRLFELSCAAYDLYALAFPSPELRRGGQRWQMSPIIRL